VIDSTSSIAVTSSGDVYTIGTYYNNSIGTACYWKNGVLTDFPAPAGAYSQANGITITSNDDVYIIGSYGSTACYWKNGARTDLF